MRQNFIEELMAAGRGVFGLLIGNRKAADYFDFSSRGLAGSFIAFLGIVVVSGYLPVLLGTHTAEEPPIGLQILELLVVFASQIGFAAIVLRQVGRLDGLVPYLVAINWTSFYISLVGAAIFAAGIGGLLVIGIIVIAAIVLQVNVLRLVVTLSPLQIGMLLIAQAVGLFIALALIGLAFPPSPEALAQLSSG